MSRFIKLIIVLSLNHFNYLWLVWIEWVVITMLSFFLVILKTLLFYIIMLRIHPASGSPTHSYGETVSTYFGYFNWNFLWWIYYKYKKFAYPEEVKWPQYQTVSTLYAKNILWCLRLEKQDFSRHICCKDTCIQLNQINMEAFATVRQENLRFASGSRWLQYLQMSSCFFNLWFTS